DEHVGPLQRAAGDGEHGAAPDEEVAAGVGGGEVGRRLGGGRRGEEAEGEEEPSRHHSEASVWRQAVKGRASWPSGTGGPSNVPPVTVPSISIRPMPGGSNAKARRPPSATRSSGRAT